MLTVMLQPNLRVKVSSWEEERKITKLTILAVCEMVLVMKCSKLENDYKGDETFDAEMDYRINTQTIVQEKEKGKKEKKSLTKKTRNISKNIRTPHSGHMDKRRLSYFKGNLYK